MKKILFALIIVFSIVSLQSKASHIAGGEISYDYVGPNPNGAGWVYDITLILYGDSVGINFNGNQTVYFSSSCNPGGQVTVNALPGLLNTVIDTTLNSLLGLNLDTYTCAAKTSPGGGGVTFTISKYTGQVVVPVVCSDWSFFWESCCRNGAISNINPGGFLFVAKLNNNLGQNSSPTFVTPPVKQFCVNTTLPFPWSHSAIEPDGDSLRYTLSQPLAASGFGPNALPGVPLAWNPGYSVTQPISTLPGTTVNLNAATGVVTFQPSQPEIDVFKIDVEEYRFDFNLGQWIFVGSSTRELQVPIVLTCVDSDGPSVNTSSFGGSTGSVTSDSLFNTYGIDSVNNTGAIDPQTGKFTYDIPIIQYNCFDSTITFALDKRIRCETLTPEGSEFRVIGPDKVARPIVEATGNCGVNTGLADVITLKLHKKLDENGIYVLYTKPGFDGNTLWDECGFPLDPYYTIFIDVNNCPELDYSLDLVTVEDDRNRRIKWSIDDPAYLQPSLFNYWNLGMKVGGNQYSIQINDINAREYLDDSEFFKDQVDHQNYEYSIQLVQNADFKKPAEDEIVTILLEDTIIFGQQSKEIQLAWNAYNGFDSAAATQYELFLGTFNAADTTLISWASYQVNNDNYFSAYQSDETTPANDGLYGMKVEATNVNDPNSLISESNWIFFLVKHEPLPDISLVTVATPNVISPNNDNVNDRFFISGVNGGREYSKIELTIYNRWGQLVYENSNFSERNNSSQGWDGTDIYTGQTLSDGVYYYVAKLQDPLTGTSEDLQGSVTILGSEGSK